MSKFNQCEKGYNKQAASAYIIYMMMGSAFKKCICSNKVEESHLRLHYMEMKQEKQLACEDRVLKQLHSLGETTLSEYSKYQAKVRFCREEEFYVVCFETGIFPVLKYYVDTAGKVWEAGKERKINPQQQCAKVC